MGLTFFGSRILTRVAGFGRAGAATRGLTVFVGDGLATGGSKPVIQLVEIIRIEGEIDVRFLISRVSHLVTRRTVRSFRVKNRTPNFGDGGGVIRSRCFKYFPHTV